MRIIKAIFVVLACAILTWPQSVPAHDEGKLLKVVALSRHGVRSPTQSDKTLAMWSQKTWPAWPVAKGDLTPRGGRLVTAMWADLRQKFLANDLLPENSCPAPGDIFVRADVDERTRATARALLDGLAPNCSTGFAVVDGKVDPLFHPVKAGLYRFNPIPTVTDILTMTHGGLEELQEDLSGPISLLGKIIGSPAPALCSRFTMWPNCQLSDLPNAISISPDGVSVRLVGSLDIASSLAEIFLLEYGEWPDVAAGWGQVDATTLSQILPIHSRVFDVVNRAPVVAWARGSSLLNEMAASLAGDHYDQRCNDAKIVVFVGHDTNLANLGSLLNINWQASGYPQNGIPPASVIFFELWEKQGKQNVLVRFYAQPPRALHAAFAEENSPASPAEARQHAPVAASVSAPPVVGQAIFALDDFLARVTEVTSGAPLAPRQTPPLFFGRVAP